MFDSGAIADDGDGARVRITSCNVLFIKCVGDTLASAAVRKGLDDFLRSLVRDSVRKAMYVNVYGKPERLRSPFAAERLYVKSIVGIIMREVMRKIDAPRPEPTMTAPRSMSSGYSRSSGSTSWSDSSVWSSWDSAGTFDDLGPVTKIIPHSTVSSVDGNGRDKIGNRVGIPILSRREPTMTTLRTMSRCSRSTGSTSSSGSSVWSSWDSAGTFDDLGPVTKLIPLSTVTGNPTRRTDRASMVESKEFITNAGRTQSTKPYGVRLPKNHKDYWTFKKIYESVAK